MTCVSEILLWCLSAAVLADGGTVGFKGDTACRLVPDAPVTACLLQGAGNTKRVLVKPTNSGAFDSLGKEKEQQLRDSAKLPQGQSKDQGHVDYLFTFGGPATLTFAPEDATEQSRCFPGIRFYRTEDDGMYQDISAEFSPFIHPKMNLLILGKDISDSTFHGCPDDHDGQPTWPSRWQGLPSVSIHTGTTIIQHARKVYDDWKNESTLTGVRPGKEVEVKDVLHLGLSAGGIVADLLSWFPVGNIAQQGITMLMDGIKKGGRTGTVHGVGLGSDWRLVGASMLKDPNFPDDWDWVALVQHVNSLDCIMAFDSADLAWPYREQRLGLRLTKEDFCGCQQCAHAGFRQELLATVQNPEYQASIKPKLQNCNKVAVTGYSLGGATADLFAYCANSGLADHPDYSFVTWTRSTPTLMNELLKEEFLANYSTPSQ